MKIIRITLKEGGDTKVILFRQEKQNASGTFPSESGKTSAGNRKSELTR